VDHSKQWHFSFSIWQSPKYNAAAKVIRYDQLQFVFAFSILPRITKFDVFPGAIRGKSARGGSTSRVASTAGKNIWLPSLEKANRHVSGAAICDSNIDLELSRINGFQADRSLKWVWSGICWNLDYFQSALQRKH